MARVSQPIRISEEDRIHHESMLDDNSIAFEFFLHNELLKSMHMAISICIKVYNSLCR